MLFWTAEADREDRLAISTLVKRYYPGLVDTGSISWEALREGRTRRFGGMSAAVARKVLDRYNSEATGASTDYPVKLYPYEDIDKWKCHEYINGLKIPGDPKLVPLYHEPRAGEKQMLLAMRNREIRAEEYGPMPDIAYIDLDRYIAQSLSIASHENPNVAYNVVFNMALMCAIMEGSKAEYPLRVVLPTHTWQEDLVSSPFEATEACRLCAVLMMHYRVDPAYRQANPRLWLPPDERGAVPLFVYRTFKRINAARSYKEPGERQTTHTTKTLLAINYQLVNYRGRRVEWAEYTDRKRITYFELRNVMAHLAPRTSVDLQRTDSEVWTMLKVAVDDDQGYTQLLVRRRKPSEEEEQRALYKESKMNPPLTRVCLDWDEDKRSIRLVDPPKGGRRNCTYDMTPHRGSRTVHTDFDRVEPAQLEARLGLSLFSGRTIGDDERNSGVTLTDINKLRPSIPPTATLDLDAEMPPPPRPRLPPPPHSLKAWKSSMFGRMFDTNRDRHKSREFVKIWNHIYREHMNHRSQRAFLNGAREPHRNAERHPLDLLQRVAEITDTINRTATKFFLITDSDEYGSGHGNDPDPPDATSDADNYNSPSDGETPHDDPFGDAADHQHRRAMTDKARSLLRHELYDGGGAEPQSGWRAVAAAALACAATIVAAVTDHVRSQLA